MGKFDGLLICTDLDGTLLGSDRKISKENIEAIEYFKSEGGLFTFITGRMPCLVDDIYNAIKPNAPFGCINGGGIYDGIAKKYIMTVEMAPSVLTLVAHVYENMPGIGIQLNTFDEIYFCHNNQAMENFRKITGYPNLERHYSEIHKPLAKIVFGDLRTEEIKKLEELLRAHPLSSEFDLISSEETLFEILPKGISKGSVLPILAKHLGIDISRTVAIGDYDNDVSMLRTAGLGFAVANASEAAKAAADRITVSNDDHAIRHIIYELE